ncbi:MAG: homocysteine S-methyltransferase family protein [Tissierellia bacterium]|nr:homocysteine S-methyltransferase family protein [Tissierellia bacterium]
MDVREKLKNDKLIFDGAMGTMLQNRGLKIGQLPEALNITSSDVVIDIHKKYIKAGADIITTNTFGANKYKLIDSNYTVKEVIDAAIGNARKAIEDEDIYIALDIGPIGELLEPMGTLSFQEAYDIFKEQVIVGVENQVDLILIETMTDLYEAKAAVLAVKENSDLPVFCTMSFEEDKRTFTGCNPTSMVMTLQGLNVDALGLNCSLGPKELEPIINDILDISRIPVMVQANAGLPTVVNDETIYNISPNEFASYCAKFVEKGVKVIGGCCGTTDEYIKELVKSLKDVDLGETNPKAFSGICSPTNAVIIQGAKVIGERINPTGKKKFKEALVNGDIEYILKEAISQVDAGAEILDVNVGLPEIDESKMIVRVIKEIQSILDTPLQIDSTDPKVIESGLRVINGKAIVNSVNGEDKTLENILPIVKKYGASVVGLTLDENGIPESAEERFRIAEKIVKKALEYGISKEDIYIDCLTLTAAAQQEGVKETLKAITMVKEKLNVKTILGVSNVSFGLPNRELINKTFLAAAIYTGLDLIIMNPLKKDMMDTIKASKVLWNEDKGAVNYLATYENTKNIESPVSNTPNKDRDLFQIILKGLGEEAKAATKKLLETKEALEIVNEFIVPALDLVGDRYEKGEIFLPQLIRSAETVKASFEIIKESLSNESIDNISKGKIILATVKGDVHDIGKNIVKVLLENYNYEVIDLGKDVSKETILEAAVENNVKLIGLSALMTTTVKSIEEIIKTLKAKDSNFTIMVGGAVLNEDYANMIDADYYGKDANSAVAIAKEVLG